SAAGGIEAAGQDIGLDPPIPLIGQELLEPPREAIEIPGGEFGNSGFQFLNAHECSVSPPTQRAQDRRSSHARTRRTGEEAPETATDAGSRNHQPSDRVTGGPRDPLL